LTLRLGAAGIALAALFIHAGTPQAQTTTTSRRFLEFRVPINGPRVPEREIPTLAPAVRVMVERGRQLAEEGRLDAAKDTLSAALALAPHHPEVLLGLANVLAARNSWRPLEQLARAERLAAHDSLLLGQDLVLALQRLGKPKEAAQAVLEAWIASPAYAMWGKTKLDTLAAADPKAVREASEKAAAAYPLRIDLVRGAAGIAWATGDAPGTLRLLRTADDAYKGAPLRWGFAEELLASGVSRDSAGAIEVLVDLAADKRRDLPYRLVAARRGWEIYDRRGGTREGAPRLARAIEDVPVARWGNPLTIDLIRGLREAGATEDARRLLRSLGDQGQVVPEIAIEHALNDLRDGPPERALEPLHALAQGSLAAAYQYAEALFFCGQPDSALAWYGRASQDPSLPFTGAALERMYVIEDASPKDALPLFGRLAYEQWRNDPRRALSLADSLYRTLPHGSLWAQAAVALAALREKGGDGKAALEPLLALAEGIPNDRLAPLARQRAGDVYRTWYHDDAKAVAQYEECLARYPKAWNAPEVRRRLDAIRREKRF
jgi:tetratricopeptide (TPR) repeat protein